jgi:tRNA(fMet)-specific endonuclease VapC
MLRYMLDTDTSSYIMRRSGSEVLTRLAAVPPADICISVISKSELLYGVEVSPRHAQDEAAVELFLRHVQTMDFPDDAAADYARIRAGLRKRGEMIGANDLLIAAHALCLKLTLVTNHTREFGRVPGLKLENWTHTFPDRPSGIGARSAPDLPLVGQ